MQLTPIRQSEEVTRLMLGGVARSCVASTLREIRGLIPLAKEGLIDDVRIPL